MKPLALVVKNIVKIVNKYNLIGGKLNANQINNNLKHLKPFMKNVNKILKTKNKIKREKMISEMNGGNEQIDNNDIEKILEKVNNLSKIRDEYTESIKNYGVKKYNGVSKYIFLAHSLENSDLGELFTIGFDSLDSYLRTLETSLVLMTPALDLGSDMAVTALNTGISTLIPGAGAAATIALRPAQKILVNVIKHNIKRFPVLFILLLNINRRKFPEAMINFYDLVPFIDDLILYSVRSVDLFNKGIETSNNYIKFTNALGEKIQIFNK